MSTRAKSRSVTAVADRVRPGIRFLVIDPNAEDSASHFVRLQEIDAQGRFYVDGHELALGVGTTVHLFSVGQGATVCLEANVEARSRLKGGLPVMVLEPPRKLERRPRRSCFRMQVLLPGHLEWTDAEGGGNRLPVTVTNLSGGGCRLAAGGAPPAGEDLSLTLDVPEDYVQHLVEQRLERDPRTRLPTEDPLAIAWTVRKQLEGALSRLRGDLLNLSPIATGEAFELAFAFHEPKEQCFRLVHFLQRRALRRGLLDSATISN